MDQLAILMEASRDRKETYPLERQAGKSRRPPVRKTRQSALIGGVGQGSGGIAVSLSQDMARANG
jgi:hypothetical protein